MLLKIGFLKPLYFRSHRPLLHPTYFHQVFIGPHEHIRYFRNRSGRHIGFELSFYVRYLITRSFFGFLSYTILRIIPVQRTRTNFNPSTIFVSIRIGRHTKLTGKDNRALSLIVQKNTCTITTVISFSSLGFPCTIRFLMIEREFVQRVPIIRKEFFFNVLNIGIFQ